ncbi:CHAT domain-containing protein [Streptomyces sp. NPDC058686]|uniref:CHAT domain-containing protein n=1 Tax=Streptomyces sp. NPDC058686 TaxID=3346599 RepID=UPI00365F1B2D
MADDEVTAEDLRAERDALLDALAAMSADDPDTPALCAEAGELSYRINLLAPDAEDLGLAAQAFGLAFRSPGEEDVWSAWRILYAHVRAFQYDAEPSPELLDEVAELLRAGMSGLAHAPDAYDAVRALGCHLLALYAKTRYLAADAADPQRLDILDEAIRLHEEASAVLDDGSEEAVDLHESRGYLHLERSLTGNGVAHTAAAAAHYRLVLDAALPTSDLPLVRHSLATALMLHGRATGDRDELEEARGEFGTALLEARRRDEGAPEWAWEAEIRSAFVRVLIWSTWKDHAHAAAAEAELNTLLAGPGATDRLLPHYLDGFGRLLFERSSARDDPAGQDRGIALLRRAVGTWVPERDGKVMPTAFFLAAFQQGRYQDDPDPARLTDVLDGARLMLADEDIPEDTRSTARMLGGWARFMQEETGTAPEPEPGDPFARMSFEEVRESFLGILDDIQNGRTFLDFDEDDEDFPGMAKGVMGPARLQGGFDAAYGRWRAAGSDPAITGRERAEGALGLLANLRILDAHGTHVTTAQKEELIDSVLATDPDDPAWQRRAHAVVAQVRLWDEMQGTGHGMDAVMGHLAQAEAAGGGDTLGQGLDLARMIATRHRGEIGAAGDDREEAGAAWRRLRESPGLTPHLRRVVDAQQASFDAHEALQRGDLETGDTLLAQVIAAHAEFAEDDPARIEVWTHIENARMVRDDLARRLGAPPAPPLVGRPTLTQLRRAAAKLPRDHRAWVLGDNGISRFVRAGQSQDTTALTEAMGLLKEAHDMVDEGSDSRLRYANCLGAGHCALAGVQYDPAARRRHLGQGIALLEAAFGAAGGPEHRLYASTGLGLGRAYRARGDLRQGDRAAGRRIGLAALRGHAWAALLQSGTDHAAQAAAQATTAALEVAGWCLRDNAPDEAVQALDACRGLVLHAATTSRTVPERLTAAGHAELAAEWRASGITEGPAPDPLTAVQSSLSVPSALRRRVLTALTGEDGHQDRLLAPPAPPEIGTALRALRKDALVYLVPATDDAGGSAVVVTSGGDVHAVPLPKLVEDAAPLRDYVSAGAATDVRDMGPAMPGPRKDTRTLRQGLDRLCSWAWYAGVRPLFDAFAARPGRVPRLVIVPMGSLGLVPWHAAWVQDGGRRRYALEEAEISYAASARLLCDVAARPAVAHTGAALVVGDPTGGLRYAGEEADAVQRAFYPEGLFLGQRAGGIADGPGTPQEVMAWLRRSEADDGAVLHLACHASIATDARHTAHLALHGGQLSAEELTEAIGGSGRGRLGLVLLAACRSHVSGRGHNEAYSLATAFLVAGARSVVGSLWPVPDDATSVLMYMTHHFLRTGDEPPAKALRRAQLWMLDPGRELPGGFPQQLARRARRIDPDDLSSWAGFTHLGQ